MKLQREAVVFGERLRELREKRGETVRSLADQMGMSFAYLSEMERGVKVPSLTTIIRLAIALDCKVTDLVDVFNRRNLRSLVPPTK
ncbi:MAG TPA: helix-turn-helix transcriptional regulator [Thermoanaerobaculia bacterium]|jgi:transcriptional regulator with XRE-family HTH domain